MITPAQFNLFVSTANTLIGQVWSDASLPLFYPVFCTTMPSGASQNVYGWTGMLPKPRVWTGPRETVEPAAQTYLVPNWPYEGPNVQIDRFHLDDDQFGIYYRTLPDQARQVKRLPDYWVRDLIEARGAFTGAIQLGLDGLSNFNTAHPIDVYSSAAGTYTNDLTGGGMTIGGILTGGAFSPTAFATSVEYMMTYKGEDGEPLGIYPSHAMFPAQLKTEAELVLKSMSFAPPAWATITGQVGAADNPFKRFGVEPLINVLLTSATKWYLQDNTKSFKAMGWQQREAPRFTPRVNENDPVVYDLHRYEWGVWGRGAPFWCPAFLMLRGGP